MFGDEPALVAARAPQPAPAAAKPPVTTAGASPPAEVAASAPTAVVKPAFDVVSVEPTGDAVIAGRAAPRAKVELRDAGRMVAEATTDDTGQFVVVSPTLASAGGHKLSLTADDGQSGAQTSNVVAVSVPAQEAKAAVVAASPAQPPAAPSTSVLVAPPAPAPADLSRVAIRSVEANAGGGLVARGSAGSNAIVRLYLNGVEVADAKTKTDGQWSLTIKHGLTGGAYVVRADEISSASADAKVLAHAETPFDYAALPASTAAPAKATPPQVATAAPEGLPPELATADPVLELDADDAGRPRSHPLDAQPQLLRRSDPLSADLRDQQGANPQPQPDLPRPGIGRAEVRAEAVTRAFSEALRRLSALDRQRPARLCVQITQFPF